jgi:aminoglycoside phosphotransferase (APT) family kinase protein
MMSLDPELLANALARMAGGARLPVEHLGRLSGGANMESWSFDWGGAGYVLRRAPSAEMMAGRPFGHDVEAALVRTARAAGVRAPEVVGELHEDDGLGTGYLMRRIEAEVNPAAILAAPPPSLIEDIACELARIHAIPVDLLGSLPVMDTGTALADLRDRFESYGGDRPIIALALRWCEDNLPEPAPLALVHGDLRMGNVMVGPEGLAAVLDWELAHLGDAHEDLAYGCMNVWRFGHVDKPAFGCSDLGTYFAAYEAASGTRVDPDRFRFWLIYRTLWWALGCLQMGEIWRSGVDRSLERAVIGRRTSENEIDLLMLLEDDAPEAERAPVSLAPPAEANPVGEPTAAELLEAVRDWVDTSVKPGAEGRDRFLAAVAMNALGMVIRELQAPVEVHDRALADDILAGRKSLATPGLLSKMRTDAFAKLANDVPKYSALSSARTKWTR